MTPALSASWQALSAAAARAHSTHLRDMFAADARRFSRFSLSWNDWLLDYSKQRVTTETMGLLHGLWQVADVPGWIARMRAGDPINHTERRAALHYALRRPAGKGPLLHEGRDVMPAVHAELQKMQHFAAEIHGRHWRGATGEPITDIVNIGIGGSDLGPRMATQALAAFRHHELRLHYVANLDGADLATTLGGLQPRTTLFVIASKTFTTQETMQNAASARHWLVAALGEAAVARHFVAVSTNLAEVARFGIDPANAFAFWDWVGGRYSLWSSIGLPLVLAVGFENFSRLLAGAHAMDEHFFSTPVAENLPGQLALLEIWNTNFLGANNRALLPYSQSLGPAAALPAAAGDRNPNGKPVDSPGLAARLRGRPDPLGRARHQWPTCLLPADPPGRPPGALRVHRLPAARLPPARTSRKAAGQLLRPERSPDARQDPGRNPRRAHDRRHDRRAGSLPRALPQLSR